MADCRLPDSALSRFDSMETETLRRILQENQALQPESALSITELPARREQAAEKSPEPAPVDRRPRKGKRPGIPGLLAAAAVVVLLLSIAINASGLWESIILWYENSFSLDSPHQDKPPYPTEEALGDFPEASAMLPTWFPEDYSPGESSVQQSPSPVPIGRFSPVPGGICASASGTMWTAVPQNMSIPIPCWRFMRLTASSITSAAITIPLLQSGWQTGWNAPSPVTSPWKR